LTLIFVLKSEALYFFVMALTLSTDPCYTISKSDVAAKTMGAAIGKGSSDEANEHQPYGA
jgi:hypothetical protein